jgi:branched-chain amino acid transport system permease protein
LTRFLVVGVFQGAVYGLVAVGLVLVYKGTRVFNFAQGEFGTVAAFVLYALNVNAHLPYGLALFIALVCAVLLGLIVERVVVRPLLNAPRLTLLVATIGDALFIIALTAIVAGQSPRSIGSAVPGGAVNILGAAIKPQQILVVFVLAGLALALAYFFSRTNLGLAVLATSQDEFATRVVGISTRTMSRFIWGFAALLGGIAGVMQAPIDFFHFGFMTVTSLIPAFAGAVLGGMTSLPGAFLGGELIGIVQNLGIWGLGQKLDVPGASELSVFVILLLVLMIRPQGLLGREA